METSILTKSFHRTAMNKAKIAKGLGAGAATLLLFYLIENMRVELNEIRERLVVLETLLEVKK